MGSLEHLVKWKFTVKGTFLPLLFFCFFFEQV